MIYKANTNRFGRLIHMRVVALFVIFILLLSVTKLSGAATERYVGGAGSGYSTPVSSQYGTFHLTTSGDFNSADHWSWDVSGNNMALRTPYSTDRIHIHAAATHPGTLTIDQGGVLVIEPEGSLQVEKLVINNQDKSGQGLVIRPQGRLTVTQTLTGTHILLQSDATGSASLIHPVNPDKAEAAQGVVERYIGSESGQWHMLSAPVSAQELNPLVLSEDHLFRWHEPSQSWVSRRNTSIWPSWSDVNAVGGVTNTFQSARGYLVSYDLGTATNTTRDFTGPLHAGAYAPALHLYSHPDDTYHGYNLVGNPYPSSIDWKSGGWDREGVLHNAGTEESPAYAYWVWNPEAGQYGTYLTSQETDIGTHSVTKDIAPMQAFWVRAASHGEPLAFNDALRVHSDQQWMKASGLSPRVLVRLECLSGNRRDEAIVEFGHGGGGGGAGKMFSMLSDAPGVYALADGRYYSIRLLDTPERHPVIPLGYRAGTTGDYRFDFGDLSGFDGSVYLRDHALDLWHDLDRNPVVAFSSPSGSNDTRFSLVFDYNPLSTPDVQVADSRIWHHQGRLYISNTHESSRVVSVYDIRGVLITQFDAPGGSLTDRPISFRPGVYIVRLGQGADTEVTRIVISPGR